MKELGLQCRISRHYSVPRLETLFSCFLVLVVFAVAEVTILQIASGLAMVGWVAVAAAALQLGRLLRLLLVPE